MPFFQPQLGAIQPSQKLDKCFGSQIGAQPSSTVLSDNLNISPSPPVPIIGVNMLPPKLETSNTDFHWPGSCCPPGTWKCDPIESHTLRKNLLPSGNVQQPVNSTEKTALLNTVSIDAKTSFEGYYESVLPKALKEPFASKSRSTPLRNLMSALSPIQSMSCSTASARIDSPLFLTASPSEELSPLS